MGILGILCLSHKNRDYVESKNRPYVPLVSILFLRILRIIYCLRISNNIKNYGEFNFPQKLLR